MLPHQRRRPSVVVFEHVLDLTRWLVCELTFFVGSKGDFGVLQFFPERLGDA